MKIEYKNGLLFIDMNIGYKGHNVLLKNVVVDTGAAHTIINPDNVYELEIKAEANDKFITVYGIDGKHYLITNLLIFFLGVSIKYILILAPVYIFIGYK